MRDELYGCYLRVWAPGPWAGWWAGIVRLEVPASVGLTLAKETATAASSWLPEYASAHTVTSGPRSTWPPVAGLKHHLHRLQGDQRLALRAVWAAVMEFNATTNSALR